ncbi:Helicase SWR1, partial [Candida maltosa Xu316]
VSNQKRKLDNLVIQAGQFNTDFLGTLVKDTKLLAQVEDEEDRVAAGVALREEVDIDNVDFKEETATAEEQQQQQEADEDEEAGHIDDYMLRFIAAGYYV